MRLFLLILFLPLMVAALEPPPPGAFTVVVLPDTQDYAKKAPEIFQEEISWILDHKQQQNIVFVTHVGDVVARNNHHQWEVASREMHRLDGQIPYGISPGNRDLWNPWWNRSFEKHFPASAYEDQAWYGGSFGNNRNSYQTIEVDGRKLLFLHLECNPPNSALNWANAILTEHPDFDVIVTTHMFLGSRDERPRTKRGQQRGPHGVMRWVKRPGSRGNSAQQIWNKCLSLHPNVMLILCGDQRGLEAMCMSLEGVYGNRVYALLSDYQDPYFRLLRFHPDGQTIDVLTYSATLDQLNPGTTRQPDINAHQFTLTYPANEQTASQQTEQNLDLFAPDQTPAQIELG